MSKVKYEPIIKWIESKNENETSLKTSFEPRSCITTALIWDNIERTTHTYHIVNDICDENIYDNIYWVNRSFSKLIIYCFFTEAGSFKMGDFEYIIHSIEDTVELRKQTQRKMNFMIDDPLPVYLHGTSPSCTKQHHYLEYVTASVFSLDYEKLVVISATYCWRCDKYFIGEESFKAYQKSYGNILVKIYQDNEFKESTRYEYNFLRTESDLALRGYNANLNGPSKNQRQNILSSLISSGLMNKRKIIEHIEFCIKSHRRHIGAVTKWQEDLIFLNNMDMANQKMFYGEIIKKISKASKKSNSNDYVCGIIHL